MLLDDKIKYVPSSGTISMGLSMWILNHLWLWNTQMSHHIQFNQTNFVQRNIGLENTELLNNCAILDVCLFMFGDYVSLFRKEERDGAMLCPVQHALYLWEIPNFK